MLRDARQPEGWVGRAGWAWCLFLSNPQAAPLPHSGWQRYWRRSRKGGSPSACSRTNSGRSRPWRWPPPAGAGPEGATWAGCATTGGSCRGSPAAIRKLQGRGWQRAWTSEQSWLRSSSSSSSSSSSREGSRVASPADSHPLPCRQPSSPCARTQQRHRRQRLHHLRALVQHHYVKPLPLQGAAHAAAAGCTDLQTKSGVE